MDGVGEYDRGAAALDALAAGDALVGIHHAGGLGAAGDEHAVPARDEHGNPVVGGALFKRLPDGGEIEGIRGEHLFHAAGAAQPGDVHRRHGAEGQGRLDAGVVLMPGHGGGAVVHDDDRALALVVDHVQQRRDARMEERAVADGAHGGLGQPGKAHAVQHAHARAHGPHGVLGIEGRQGAEVVAADVARHRHLHLGKVVERGAVRAAGAQQRAAAGEGFGRVAERGGRIFKDARLAAAFGDVLRQQFAADGENVLAARGDAHSPDLLLDEGVKLLDHDDVAHAVRELPGSASSAGGSTCRSLRMEASGKTLLHVFVDDAPGDEAVFAVAPFDAVAGPRVAPFLDVQQALFKDVVPLARPRAHGVVLARCCGGRGRPRARRRRGRRAPPRTWNVRCAWSCG